MLRTLPLVLLFTAAAVPGCKKEDPYQFETHLEKIKDPGARATGFSGLESLVKTIVTAPDNKDRLQEFAEKVIPVFEEVWEDSGEQHEAMLLMLRDVGHPDASKIWNKALAMDGSSEARKETLLALEGIKKSKATDSVEAILEELKKLVADPKNDKGKEEGKVRLTMVETLGALGQTSATPVLITVMEQTKDNQPVSVHRAAAKALGQIGDPAATEALLTVQFRVPDTPSTTDIGNRSKLAVVAIGDPAVDKVLQMLRGDLTPVNELAAKNGVPMAVVKQTAAGILAAMGTTRATEELLAFMPKDDCSEETKGSPDPEAAGLRAFVANALGFIGDPKAAGPLCGCINATHNPGDMFPITEALGRIGGDTALTCLVETVKTGEYNPEYLENSDFRFQIRWEAARFAVLVAPHDKIGTVKDAIAGNTDAKVKENVGQWEPGIKVAEECKDDKACYTKVVGDATAEWFAREKAAYELARLGAGDPAVALTISEGFKVRNPDARVTMAWLPARMLAGKKCDPCADAIDKILAAEKGTMDATMQLAVLTARNSIAKLRTGSGAGGPPAAPAAPEAKAPAKAEGKGDAKAEGKGDAKAEGKSDAKAEGKGDAKAEGKGDAKADGKADGKAG